MRHALLNLFLALTPGAFALGATQGGADAVHSRAASPFVSVEGHEFRLYGRGFHYAGWNTYYLMQYAADPALRSYVVEVLDEAAALGLSVLRTWAFNDGAAQWNALQIAPGVYQEYVFRGLDYVLDQARRRGLKVLLALVNNWDDYGGMNQYVAWSQTATSHDQFYTDALCRQWYTDHAAAVAERVNTFNGVAYADDPTILGWDLANEARCASDVSGAVLQEWTATMAAHLKAVAPLQLVTTGSEGFYGPTDAASNPRSWMSSQGVDFVANHLSVGIDFASVHTWPDPWGLGLSETIQWVGDHASDAELRIGKPVVFEEFGVLEPIAIRNLYFYAIYDEIYSAAASGGAAAGSHFWHLIHDDYAPFDDGFGVLIPAHASTAALIATEAARMRALP
ncbi:MAG: cellulase family glycosylhydrolase [Planctomycetota bacterium]|jgi:mannan endo-1,4-beta-mannosidase|nr:cellulase family glycosylhydrolase [Planctomycetota bacterium]